MNRIHAYFRSQGLVRRTDERFVAGVCAGFARRFGISPLTMRLIFVVALIVLPGSQILIYPLLWLLMPSNAQIPAAPNDFRAPTYHS